MSKKKIERLKISRSIVRRAWPMLTAFFYKKVTGSDIATNGYTHTETIDYGEIPVDNFKIMKDLDTLVDKKYYRVETTITLAIHRLPEGTVKILEPKEK